jgi:hypothetical protein
MKTTPEDLDKVAAYLKSQVGWVEVERIKKAIPAKHANGMKIEAMRFVGLLDRDGANVKLTEKGREFAAGDASQRAETMRDLLRGIALYKATLDWVHFHGKENVSKTDVANYWHDSHPTETGGALGDALTDSSVFFMRMVGLAGLGKFVGAGHGRDTHLEVDTASLAQFVTGDPGTPEERNTGQIAPPAPPPPPPRPPQLMVGSGLNVNVEIHIAADAKPATIEEIFKNMRKYLLEQPDTANGG